MCLGVDFQNHFPKNGLGPRPKALRAGSAWVIGVAIPRVLSSGGRLAPPSTPPSSHLLALPSHQPSQALVNRAFGPYHMGKGLKLLVIPTLSSHWPSSRLLAKDNRPKLVILVSWALASAPMVNRAKSGIQCSLCSRQGRSYRRYANRPEFGIFGDRNRHIVLGALAGGGAIADFVISAEI